MLPFLAPGEIVLTSFLPLLFYGIKINDVVVFIDTSSQTYFIKRVITINGTDIFVQGDNSKVSTDSRHFGPIQKSQIIGKVIVKL